MHRSWFLVGLILFLLLGFVLFPFFIGVPWDSVFSSDAIDYSKGAINLLVHRYYSIDGISPFLDREPGMSVFLLLIYALAGIENGIAVTIVQSIVLFGASWFFCQKLALITTSRVAGITFLLILTSGSVLHTVFSAYRECLALSLLLVFSGVYLHTQPRSSLTLSVLLGVLLGLVILTYYTFIFFPLFLLVAWVRDRRPVAHAVLLCVTSVIIVSAWGLRNASYDGHFRIIDNRRSAVMWYVRGEQAERLRGLEPFRCLWSEYVSRNWVGRSDACSFNSLMHIQWPPDHTFTQADYARTAAAGQVKILRFFPWYLWFSLFEILELHLPFLGAGWSHAYNMYASWTHLLLAFGFLFGLLRIMDRRLTLFAAFIVYNTGVFIFTDATPRYLFPVFFSYAAIAGVGYDALLRYFNRPRL